MIKNDIGKEESNANLCLNKFNDPLDVPKIS
jgi:hypothetical protein